MAFRDILAPLFGESHDSALVDALEAMDLVKDAHIAATMVCALPDPVFVGDGMMAATVPMGELIGRLRQEAEDARTRAHARLARTALAFEMRLAIGQTPSVVDQIATQARHVDLTVMMRPALGLSDLAQDVAEAAMMDSGRPLLLVPEGWRPVARPRTVLVAWNASREAARAVADAMPFLRQAGSIVVGTVDARPSPRGHGEAPGVDIATHLARHGLAVDLRNLTSSDAGKGATIMRTATEIGADLIVLGAFGHPRLQQALFGGVTRTLIDTAPAPMLLSH